MPQSILRNLALVAFTTAAMRANTSSSILILSGVDETGIIEWNSRTGANVLIQPYGEPAWKAPTMGGKWISYTPSGSGQLVVDNAGMPSPFNITAVFYRSFMLPGPAASGGVWIWADDTAAVLVDGASRYALPNSAIRGAWCSVTAIGCQPSLGAFVDLTGLGAGPHTLEIQAYQLWGDAFGVLYEGAIDVSVPEGSTLVAAATAMALFLMRLRYVRKHKLS